MTTQTVYTDLVQFKSAIPIGFGSKEYYEQLSNITVCILSREDYNDHLEADSYDTSGIVLVRLPEQDDTEKIVILRSEYMSSTARHVFAERPECSKIVLIRRGQSFDGEDATKAINALEENLRARGVTVETNEKFILPTPFEELFASGYAQTIMAALKMDNFVFPNRNVDYSEVLPNTYISSFFDFGIKKEKGSLTSHNKQGQVFSDIDLDGNLNKTYETKNISQSKTVPKTNKKGKNHARESFTHISVKNLLDAGLIHPNRDIKFRMAGLDDSIQLPTITLLSTGTIKVGDTITNTVSQAGQKIYDLTNKNSICKSAWAQFRVKTPVGEWKPLKEIRKTYSDMLKIKGAANAKIVKQNLRSISMKDIVEAKILPTQNIHASVRGIQADGTITSEGNIIVNNTVYGSPTGALNGALKNLKGDNEPRYKDGWTAWLVKNSNGEMKPLKYYRDMLK